MDPLKAAKHSDYSRFRWSFIQRTLSESAEVAVKYLYSVYTQVFVVIMSAVADDPRDPSAETKLTFPKTWDKDSAGS